MTAAPGLGEVASVQWGGETLGLLAERAVWLEDRRCLLVADVHLGKAATFRRLGLPVPRGTTTGTLDRLAVLVERLAARRVIVLGDLLHSEHAHAASTLGAFARWRVRHARLELVLVRGNHDDRAGDPPASLGIEVVTEPLHVGGLALAHHPRPVPGRAVLAGHLHPCVRLGGRAGDRMRLPCFHFSRGVGVLPAFGEFTGMHPVQPSPGDLLFLVAEDRVVPWPSAASAPGLDAGQAPRADGPAAALRTLDG
ncbi:MAG: ligase-associated DNA damage response endonuclease PdeM [Ideonella sp.]|nr:ligase-associated DNA damage response endonuclease PdeM [Ideonella sp.]